MKTCSKCKRRLEFAYFHNNSHSPDGLRSDCKRCHRKTNNEGYRARAGGQEAA